MSGAGPDVMTLSKSDFNNIKNKLLENVAKKEPMRNGNGVTYTTKDGGKFNIRYSKNHGETIDINVKNLDGLPKGLRFHQE